MAEYGGHTTQRLRSRWLVGCMALLVLLLVGCSAGREALVNSGPQLLQDVTLAPTTPVATRMLSPTPPPVLIPVVTSTPLPMEPLQIITLQPGVELVTPTLPPSKTPTLTPTQTATYTPRPPATSTQTPLPYAYVFPTPPPAAGGAVMVTQRAPLVCTPPWFFSQTQPASCPLNSPLVSPGAFQLLEKGYLVWVQQQDAIYALYISADAPRWQVFNDTFEDGMAETDLSIAPPEGLWQPRRGFGLVWRSRPEVGQRLGWALSEVETVYTVQVQIGSDGTIFMNEPGGAVFGLAPGGTDWRRY